MVQHKESPAWHFLFILWDIRRQGTTFEFEYYSELETLFENDLYHKSGPIWDPWMKNLTLLSLEVNISSKYCLLCFTLGLEKTIC
jgi:hypothetical protein